MLALWPPAATWATAVLVLFLSLVLLGGGFTAFLERYLLKRSKPRGGSRATVQRTKTDAFRIRGLPKDCDKQRLSSELTQLFPNESNLVVRVASLSPHPTLVDQTVATVHFDPVPSKLLGLNEAELDVECTNQGNGWGRLSIDCHFFGLTPLHAIEDEQSAIDVFVVPGLGGHAFGSFKERGGDYMWVRDSLPQRMPNARIFLYGYDSRLAQSDSFQTLRHLGAALTRDTCQVVESLATRRAKGNYQQDRFRQGNSIVFIGHSLGGLLVKEAVVQLDKPSLKGMLQLLTNVVLFGVPNKGMDITSLRSMAGNGPNRNLLETLGAESDTLVLQGENFQKAVAQAKTKVMCYHETKMSPTAIQDINGTWTMSGPLAILVGSDSATLLGHLHEQVEARPMNRNHSDLVKFRRHDHDGDSVLYYLQAISGNAITKISRRQICQPQPPELSKTQLKCLQTIASINYRESLITARSTGTCAWLQDDVKYKKWKEQNSAMLSIRGPPGSGKSTLMKAAVDSSVSAMDCLTLAFFFDASGGEQDRTQFGMIRHLLYKLARGYPHYCEDFFASYDKNISDVGSYGDKWQWTDPQLETCLFDALLRASKEVPIELYVDALDEAGEKQAVAVASKLRSLTNRASEKSCSLKVCHSCRYFPNLPYDPEYTIIMEDCNGGDIDTFMSETLSEHSHIVRSAVGIKVQSFILDRADGSFQWTKLVLGLAMDMLRDGESLESVTSVLGNLPKELNDIYKHLLEQIEIKDRPASFKLFQWVCFSFEPLSLGQMQYALALDPATEMKSLQDLHNTKLWQTENLPRLISRLSRGLITFSEKSSEVRVTHKSVRDFVVSNGPSLWPTSAILAESPLMPGRAHYCVSAACLQYLGLREGESEVTEDSAETLESSASLDLDIYATRYWPVHSARSEDFQYSQAGLVDCIEESDGRIWTTWQTYWETLGRNIWLGPRDESPLIHVLAFYGILSALDRCIELNEECVNFRDQYGYTPLMIAASEGNESIVARLLELNETDVGATDLWDRTALYHAVTTDHPLIVEQILQNGTTKEEISATVSVLAADNNVGAIRLLLKLGKLRLQTLELDYDSLALKVVISGSFQVASYFLQEGVIKANSQDSWGRTMLSYAACHGRIESVKALLQIDGIEVNSRDLGGWSPLTHATRWNMSEAARLLLAVDTIEPDARDIHGCTPLWYAVQNRSRDIAAQLLARDDVNPNQADERGVSPFSSAERCDDWKMMDLLLKSGKLKMSAEDKARYAALVASKLDDLQS